MTKQSRRLPRGLKKKLEASLSSLTPREAGRLFLIYLNDVMDRRATEKSYAPIDELEAAWDRRVEEARRKGVEAGNAEAAKHNGYTFLQKVAVSAHDTIQAELWRVGFSVLHAATTVDKLLHADAVSQLARVAIDDVLHVAPRPVSHADYDRMLRWAESDDLVNLDEAADNIVGKLFHPTYATFDYDNETVGIYGFWEAHKDRFEADTYWDVNREELRRVYAEVEGDRLLKDVFEGDRSRLEFWVENAYFTHPADQERFDEEVARMKDRLVAMVEAGELTGARGVYFTTLYAPVLIRDGKLPAWAALRIVWEDWLADHGVFERPLPRMDTKIPDGVADLGDGEGPVVGDRLTALVVAFLKECRSKPWGKGLAKKVDVDDLAVWLVAVETPLTLLDAPDLGLVDWETFRTHEGDERANWEPSFFATFGSLKAHAEALGAATDFDWGATLEVNDLRESYYPVAHPEARRDELGRVILILKSLQTSQRAFTYREEKRPGQLSLQDLLGVTFFTPLEEAVKDLGEAFGEVETIRKAVERIEQKYFDGMPLLNKNLAERLDNLQAILEGAEADLATWLDKLSKWPWAIDVSSLRLVKQPAAPDEVAAQVGLVEVMPIMTMTNDDKVEIDLGDGPQPAKDFKKLWKEAAR